MFVIIFYDLNFPYIFGIKFPNNYGKDHFSNRSLVNAGSWCRSASRKEDQHLRLKAMLIVFHFTENLYSQVFNFAIFLSQKTRNLRLTKI